MPIGMYVISADGHPLLVNDACLRVLGLKDIDELAALSADGFPGRLPMHAAVARAARNDRAVGVVAPWTRPDGDLVVLRHSITVMRDGNGRIVRYQGTVEERAENEAPVTTSILEQRYERVVEQISEALLIDDRDGHVVYANPAFLTMFGLQPEDLENLVLEDYVAPEWRSVLRERHERRIRGESVPSVFQYVGLRRDGARLRLEVSVVTVIENGELLGTQSIIRDITETQRLQDDLYVLHRTLDSLIEELPLAIIGLDEHHRVVRWNPTAARMLGWSHDQIIGKRCPGWDYEARGTSHRDVLRSIIAGERACVDFETQWPRCTDSDTPDKFPDSATDDVIDVAVWTLFGQQDDKRGVKSTLVLADIGARMSTRADYRRLFDNDHDAILLIDPATLTVLEANRQAKLLYTQSNRPLVGTSITRLYEQPAEAEKSFKAMVENRHSPNSGHQRRKEHKHRSGDGRLIDVEVNLAFINYAGREVITSHNRDVTHHKQIIQRAQQSHRMESLGRLAGGVAHDFNNVLTALMGYPTLIKRRLAPDHPAVRHLDELRVLAERAAGLTRQLLAFSRQQVLRLQHLIPGEIVSQMRELLRRLIREDIDLHMDIAPGQKTVYADASQIEQLVMNLVVNARDAMPHGGSVRIAVTEVLVSNSAAEDLPSGDYISILVEDTGIGMDAAVKERLFEPFFTTKDVGKGTGLGLATVQGIVKQHAGTIRVDSEVGQGSRFRIYLPASRADDAPAGVASPGSGGSATLDNGQPLTILVVEDDEAVRVFVSEVLEQAGHRLFLAVDGMQGQESLDEHSDQLDLILTDLVMPKRGGGPLSAYVAERYPHIPILFMSGYTNEPTLRRLLEQPDIRYLQKPFSPSTLLGEIERIVACTSQERAHAVKARSTTPATYRILLVDDSVINRRLGRLYLENVGHRVDVAENGKQALSAVKTTAYDIVFMDCHMPIMDGYDATTAIRTLQPPTGDVPIIAITGNVVSSELDRCRTVGMNDVVMKPFKKGDLQRAIAQWLKQ